jgi:hypothetical protein
MPQTEHRAVAPSPDPGFAQNAKVGRSARCGGSLEAGRAVLV